MYGSVGTNNANVLAHWTAVTTVNSFGDNGMFAVLASNGRAGGSCLRFTAGSNAKAYLSRTLDAQGIWGVTFALRPTVLPTNTLTILQFRDGTSTQVVLL